MIMKVVYLTALRELEIRDLPQPKLDRPDDVLLRIDRVGICGSDVHYYMRGRIGDQEVQYPATIGHECSGTVVQLGPAPQRLAPGDRVAIEPAIHCGHCDQCRIGRVNTCRSMKFQGCPGGAPGAMAEFCVLPAQNCLPIPDDMTFDQATLIEPLSIGLYSVRMAELAAGARIAVLGAGPIGLGVLLCAKAVVECTALVTDLLDERLEVARLCGADWTGNPEHDDVYAKITEQVPSGLDVVLECSGDPEIIDPAQRLLTPGGMLVLVGIPSAPRLSFDSHHMRRHELTFKNVRRQKGCAEPAIRMIGQRRLDPTPLLTHRFPLEKIVEGFELVAGYRDGVVKAVIDLSGAE